MEKKQPENPRYGSAEGLDDKLSYNDFFSPEDPPWSESERLSVAVLCLLLRPVKKNL